MGWAVPGATGVKCECEYGWYGYMSVYSPQEYVSVLQPFEGTGDTEESGVIVALS